MLKNITTSDLANLSTMKIYFGYVQVQFVRVEGEMVTFLFWDRETTVSFHQIMTQTGEISQSDKMPS